MNDPRNVIIDLLTLVDKYWKVKRATVVLDRFDENLEIIDGRMRENLVEHVGLLPIIASFIYPHITNAKDVNLERSLAILSIHDIAETVIGDIPTSKKTDQDSIDETEVVKKMLNPQQLEWYTEFDEGKTSTALFVRGIDKIATFVDDMLLPSEAVISRLDHYGFEINKLIGWTEKLYTWDVNFYEMYKVFIEEYKIILNKGIRTLIVK